MYSVYTEDSGRNSLSLHVSHDNNGEAYPALSKGMFRNLGPTGISGFMLRSTINPSFIFSS